MAAPDPLFPILENAFRRWNDGNGRLPPAEEDLDPTAIEGVLLEVAERLRDNCPYHHPLYAGQMLEPPHAVARLAYQLALFVNPNNHALDGGRASSAMEKEAVAELARLFGFDEHLGHLTGGGTMANLEALWVASRLAPGKTILASEQAHYTHGRLSQVLGLPFEALPVDEAARIDLPALKRRLEGGDVGTVVATIGTTGLGAVDPLDAIVKLRARHGFRLHADAAYGGYFLLADGLRPETRSALDALGEVDSLVVDPHKHGLQPYGCGCVLFRDPEVGRFYKHDSPYTYFSSAELHLGEISLECSRPGAAAVALWATQRLFPHAAGGSFARNLGRCRMAALALHERCAADEDFLPLVDPELDIVAFAPAAKRCGEISRLSRDLFRRAEAADLHLALLDVPTAKLPAHWSGVARDVERVTCLRCCLMKAAHLDWVDEIWARIRRARAEGAAEGFRS